MNFIFTEDLFVQHCQKALNRCRCELIDTENISLSSQNMKFVVEQADIFPYRSYSHSDDMFIILELNLNTDTSIFVFSREKSHDSEIVTFMFSKTERHW
jgi:hypothetical protein